MIMQNEEACLLFAFEFLHADFAAVGKQVYGIRWMLFPRAYYSLVEQL